MIRFQSIVNVFLIATCTLVSPLALAANLSFLNGTAMQAYTEEDHRQLREAAVAALDDAATPATRTWHNEASGNHGEVRTLAAFIGPNSVACKRLRIENFANKRRGRWTFNLCNIPPDGWRLVSSDFLKSGKSVNTP